MSFILIFCFNFNYPCYDYKKVIKTIKIGMSFSLYFIKIKYLKMLLIFEFQKVIKFFLVGRLIATKSLEQT